MAYKIKNKQSTQKIAKHLKWNYYELENKAQQVYGTDFDELSIKEQDEISRKVAKDFHYKILD